MHNTNAKKSNRPVLFWGAFWITIAALVALYIVAQLTLRKVALDEYGNIVISEQVAKEWEVLLPGMISEMNAEFKNADDEIDLLIEQKLDIAFAPVYQQTDKIANFHYSVQGEYTEMLAAITGKLEQDIERKLFNEVNLAARIEAATNSIHASSKPIIANALQKVSTNIQQTMTFTDSDMKILGSLVTLTVADAEARFSGALLALRGVGSAVAIKATGAVAAKTMVKKMASKGLLKVASKWVMIGSSGAAGATVGAACGPICAAIGGVIGAAGAWIAVDKIIVELDEHFNRDEFTAELIAMIDNEKKRIKNQVKSSYHQYIVKLATSNQNKLQGIRTKDLIHESY